MLSLDEARGRLLAGVGRLSIERLPLGLCAGRVLAEDLSADEALPAFDHSAMDGYAVRTTDFEPSGPWTLAVRSDGDGSAGSPALPLQPRTAARIFTGAPIPSGADAVVMQERVARSGGVIVVDARPEVGQHIRRAGEDLARGALVFAAGTRLGPGGLALAAMAGRVELPVARRPRVTILCTGNELRGPGEAARPATIPESNSVALAALAEQTGATARVAPIARDDAAGVERAVRDALEGTDVLLTVGGVSVGDHDVVRPALQRAGVTLDFWKVAIKPGKPIAVGRTTTAYVLGLPGNPASALVTLAIFGAPLLRAMQGDARGMAVELPARMAHARKRSPDRVEFLRGALGREGDGLVAKALDNQASGAATTLATSDGLIVVAPGPLPVERGSVVDFLRWADV